MTQPQVLVIAGPNGAGKSSLAPVLLRERLGIIIRQYPAAPQCRILPDATGSLRFLSPIRRRFVAGLRNLLHLYPQACDHIRVYDALNPGELIATRNGDDWSPKQAARWQDLKEIADA